MKDQTFINLQNTETKKSLALLWKLLENAFVFQAKVEHCSKITKRSILADIATLYDQLDWLAPVIIKTKVLIQELCKKQLQWDEIVDEKTAAEWVQFQEQLETAERIKVPRWRRYQGSTFELHCF